MAIDKEKAEQAAREVYKLLHGAEGGLKYEEVTIALMYMSTWDMTRLLEENDLHRVPTYLWNWSKAIEFFVDEELAYRYKRWRDSKTVDGVKQ